MDAYATLEMEQLSATLTLVGSRNNETNTILVDALHARGIEVALASALDSMQRLGPDDLALVRLDVLPTLDGVEPGLVAAVGLERRGVRVLNRARSLLAAHDKLRTSRILGAAGLPHPRTTHVVDGGRLPDWDAPFVLKPRFGSWGRDVFRCPDRDEAERILAAVGNRRWFRRHGVLVQELLPARGHDLRLIVAGGDVIGAAKRFPAAGEWRTNVTLGGSLEQFEPPAAARTLACRAAAAIGADVVGVDLFPSAGGYTVLELNGAVDFDGRYSLPGRDIHDDLIRVLSLSTARRSAAHAARAPAATRREVDHERRHETVP